MMGAFAPIASAAPSGPQNQSNQNQSNQNPGNHQQTPTQKRITTFGSCAALNRTYPHGVARAGARDRTTQGRRQVRGYTVNTNVYNHNKRLDYDNDGIACER